MALFSARLAVATTLTALLVTGAAHTGVVAPALLAAAIVAWRLGSLLRTVRMYANPAIRARVTIAVANG
jgi:hypothetical protein